MIGWKISAPRLAFLNPALIFQTNSPGAQSATDHDFGPFTCVSTEHKFVKSIYLQKADQIFKLAHHGRPELIETWKILPTGLNVQFWSRYSKRIHPGAYRGRITLFMFGQILRSQENT